jgi:hypothetical protein
MSAGRKRQKDTNGRARCCDGNLVAWLWNPFNQCYCTGGSQPDPICLVTATPRNTHVREFMADERDGQDRQETHSAHRSGKPIRQPSPREQEAERVDEPSGMDLDGHPASLTDGDEPEQEL